MPRTGKGGQRAGAVGSAYANRSDMNGAPAPEPITTVPGQGYGQAAAEKTAQRAIPVAGTPVASAPTAPQGGGGAAPSASLAPAQAPPSVIPGQLVGLDAPTQRPNEPVTAGLPQGPGPGPEALTGVGQQGFAHSNVANLLTALAQIPGAGKEIQGLADYAQSGKG